MQQQYTLLFFKIVYNYIIMQDFWNNRYNQKDYAYGTQANQFFTKQIQNLQPGKALFPAEGEGRNAVYVVRVDKTISEPATTSYETEIQSMLGQAKSSIQNDAINSLREKSNIVDNRRFLKVGVRY